MIFSTSSVAAKETMEMDRKGSAIVFEDVVADLSVPLRRYLERLTGNRATADDLLQETLLKIARALPGFEGRSSVKTWAFTIATRVATDHFRKPENRAQVAEIAGCSLATAKIRIHRARGRLRDALNRECIFYRDKNNVLRCDRKQDG